MCRKGGKEAGRRCPSHTEPKAIEERNEVRREQYANKVTRDKLAESLTRAGVKFIRGDEIKNAYFQGKETFDPEKFEAIEDPFQDEYLAEVMPSNFWSKPQAGGLWTSPGRMEGGKVKTAWTDWSVENDFNAKGKPVNPIHVKKQAVIVVIDSEEDLEALCRTYPRLNGFSFKAMADAGIDGLRLSHNGHRASKGHDFNKKIQNFSIWDLDSTVWLNSDNISGGKAVQQGEYPDDENDRDYSPWDDEEENTEEPVESWDDIMAELEASSKQEVIHDEKEIAATRLRMKLQG